MQRKKSRFLLFIFSFFPGVGEMYMGFMKMGVSLMLGFGVLGGIVGLTNLPILGVFPVVMYFYSFFHANHLGSLDDMSFRSVQDRFLFGLDSVDDFNKVKSMVTGKHRKVVALSLIFIGLVMLWQAAFNLLCDIFGWDNAYLSTIYFFMRDDIPRFILAFVIIWCGIVLIRGKKVEILPEEQDMFSNPHEMGREDRYAGTYRAENQGMPAGAYQEEKRNVNAGTYGPESGSVPGDLYQTESRNMPGVLYQAENRNMSGVSDQTENKTVPAASYRAENQVIYVEPGSVEDKSDR